MVGRRKGEKIAYIEILVIGLGQASLTLQVFPWNFAAGLSFWFLRAFSSLLGKFVKPETLMREDELLAEYSNTSP